VAITTSLGIPGQLLGSYFIISNTDPASIMGITIHKYYRSTNDVYSGTIFLCLDIDITAISFRTR